MGQRLGESLKTFAFVQPPTPIQCLPRVNKGNNTDSPSTRPPLAWVFSLLWQKLLASGDSIDDPSGEE